MTALNDVPMFSDMPHISAGTERQSASESTDCSDVYQIVAERIPEIAGGAVQVVGIARASGYSTKIGVTPRDPGFNAIRLCADPTKIADIRARLGGELVTFVEYSSSPERYVAEAFRPVPILSCTIIGEQRVQVVVPEDFVARAIGKAGINARLVSELTEFNVQIVTPANIVRQFDDDEFIATVAANAAPATRDADIWSALLQPPVVRDRTYPALITLLHRRDGDSRQRRNLELAMREVKVAVAAENRQTEQRGQKYYRNQVRVLAIAIAAHRDATQSDASPADTALWELLDEITVPMGLDQTPYTLRHMVEHEWYDNPGSRQRAR
jgi:transcription antitermination factor NusA-like protein